MDDPRTNPVAQIQRAIRGLSREELSAFRAWFERFDAEAWDREIDTDAAAGRLDALAGEALADFRAGRARPL